MISAHKKNIHNKDESINDDRKLDFLYFFSRLMPLIFGFIGAYCSTLYLSKEEQGVFFLMLSFVSAQVIFEGGMYFQMQQKLATLVNIKDDLIEGYKNPKISALWFKSITFLILASLIYFIFTFFLARYMMSGLTFQVIFNLELFFFLISIRFVISGIEAMLEGSGYRVYVTRIKILYALINGMALCILLIFDYGLNSLLISYFIAIAFLLFFHAINKGKTLIKLVINGIKNHNRFSWRDEMLSVQIRLGVSWIFGYFTHQSMVPILFYISGPVAAGQFGFLMSIVNAIKSLSSTFIAKESPLFGSYISSKNYYGLKLILQNVLLRTLVLVASLIMLSLLGLWVLSLLNPDIFSRLPSTMTIILILICIFFMQINLILANFVRAHNKEPFMLIGIIGGIITPLSIALASYISTNDIAIGLAIFINWISLGLILPWIIAREYLNLLRTNIG
jgi:hypothetical protein